MKLPEKDYKIIMDNGNMVDVKGKVFQTMLMPKHSFGIRKIEKGYIVDHIQSGMNLAIKEKTENEAFEKLQELLKDKEKVAKIKATLTLKEIAEKVKHFKENVNEFEQITNLRLPVTVFGVDARELDAKLEHPPDTAGYIQEKYGDRACELIEEMMMEGFFYADKIEGFWIKREV